jgi:hypothetical protein
VSRPLLFANRGLQSRGSGQKFLRIYTYIRIIKCILEGNSHSLYFAGRAPQVVCLEETVLTGVPLVAKTFSRCLRTLQNSTVEF